jgi:uncharacterized protein CbrC (UPF0167 family)
MKSCTRCGNDSDYYYRYKTKNEETILHLCPYCIRWALTTLFDCNITENFFNINNRAKEDSIEIQKRRNQREKI